MVTDRPETAHVQVRPIRVCHPLAVRQLVAEPGTAGAVQLAADVLADTTIDIDVELFVSGD